MRVRAETVRDGAALLGALGLTAGVGWMHVPAGVVTGAILLLVVAIYIDHHTKRRGPR